MNVVDIIIIAVVAVIVGLGARHIDRSKKRGVTCIGCPEGANCPGSCSDCAGNCSRSKEK